METNTRPDPDALLHALKKEEHQATKAKLKIFFGMCAGVGKTYDMLKSAHEAKAKGLDVVIGVVETHKRPETETLLAGLPLIPRRKVEYKGTILEEMDLDAIIARAPQLVLVDELAHTNAPGSRHAKRYQAVLELLDNGIDVYATLNVQHLESRADTVAQITGAIVHETVPDSIFELADSVEIIDIPPDELLKRLTEGKVYAPERSQRAIESFFRPENLTALREMALRLVAERVDHQLRDYMQTKQIAGPWKSGVRLLVGISASPHSVSLIRWARRMAYTMDATWIAVYVETARTLTDATKTQLAKNITLARELGAEIVTTADENIAEALVRVARQQNATQLLVGKPRRTFSFRKSLLDQVIERSGDLDVYVIGNEERTSTRKAIQLPEIHSGGLQYAVAAGIVGVVVLLSYPLSPIIGYQTVSLMLLLTVALLSLRLGAGPVLLAAAISALVWNYFFIPPQFTFAIGMVQDVLMFVAYFAIAAVTGTLTARIRAREKAVRGREERAVALYTLTRDLSIAPNQDEVAKAAVANIRKFFNAEVAVFLSEPDGDVFTRAHGESMFVVDEKEFSVAAWVYWNEKKAGKFTETLPFASATYFPMSGPRYPLGVIGVRPVAGERFTIDQEALLENFIRQIASTLEREQLNDLTRKSLVVAESERLYKNLFDSISHEFKTPIATILGTAEQLLHDPSAGTGKTALQEMHVAAERLNRLVANLLDMTRVESGRLKPKLDWVDVGDLVATTVRKLEGDLRNHHVSRHAQGEIPLVRLDFGLMEQALTNILHNAIVHTPAGTNIEINTGTNEKECVIDIVDNGPGVPADSAHLLFRKFFRVQGAKSGGTGLGLSIARGFVEAHGGTIAFENRSTGGARFTIRIPMTTLDQHVRPE